MNVNLICVGKIKESYLREAISEYEKRLSKYCKLTIYEVNDEKTIDKQSDALNDRVKKLEGERILKLIGPDDYVITLEINGKMLDSIELANFIDKSGIEGRPNLTFIIGGSLGLDAEVSRRSDYKLSFSKMTFPHQLMRVILLEQVYRSFRIIHNEPYHK